MTRSTVRMLPGRQRRAVRLVGMKRREFIALVSATAASWPFAARSQTQPAQAPPQPADASIGQVATVSGSASVTRGNAAAAALKAADLIFKKDTLETAATAALGITFDDGTTFSLSGNTRIVVDDFVYRQGGNANAATFNVALGTAAFVASLVAQTGNMKIATPEATLGIRGTTGVVEVPQAGGAAAPTIKLYPDANGHVGQIEVFDRQGTRLGALTRGASAFALRPGAGGRIAAVPYQIPPQELARDRGVLQRLAVSHNIGRQMLIRRQRSPGRMPPNNRPGGGPQNRPGGPFNRAPRAPAPPRGPRKNPNDNRR